MDIKSILTVNQYEFLCRIAESIKAAGRLDNQRKTSFITEYKGMARGYIRCVIDTNNKLNLADFKTIWAWFNAII